MKTRRALVVGPSPPPYAGVEIMTQNILASESLLSGWTLIHCNTQKPGGQSAKGELSLRNLLFTLRGWMRYVSLLVRKHPDLVHLPLSQNRTGFLRDSLFVLTASLFRRPLLLHFHGGAFDHFYGNQAMAAKKFIEWILAKADLLVVLGGTIARQFDGLVAADRIACIPNCIGPEHPAPPERQQRTDVRILFLGKISVAKGAIDFVKAADLLLQEPHSGKLKFKLVGEYVEVERNITFIESPHGVRQRLTELLAQPRCQAAVTVAPAVNGHLKWTEYTDADIFVAPSYSEGFPLTVIEAMAMGLPIVATNVGALPEMLVGQQSSFVVPVGNPSLLAARISELANDPGLRSRLSQENRRRAEHDYNLASFAKYLETAYGRALLLKTRNGHVP